MHFLIKNVNISKCLIVGAICGGYMWVNIRPAEEEGLA